MFVCVRANRSVLVLPVCLVVTVLLCAYKTENFHNCILMVLL